MVFEAFEASPLSEKVLASGNALQWDFPAYTVAIPYATFTNISFRENLATFLEQASTESIKRFAARTSKANSSAFESRDTVNPSVITQMLMTLLEANGDRIYPPRLRKHVRDDVCWTNGAEMPWRRSAYWLVLRVGLQRYLYALHGVDVGRAYYKFFASLFLARLIEEALHHSSPDVLAFLNAKLTRRLVKLEAKREVASEKIRLVYEIMFTALGSLFRKVTKGARESIEQAWNNLKQSILRRILPLPRYASQTQVYLSLPNSNFYLQRVFSEWYQAFSVKPQSFEAPRPLVGISSATANNFKAFADLYYSLSRLETDVEAAQATASNSTNYNDIQCIHYAEQIKTYQTAAAAAYESAEQNSLMILTIMELWMALDQCAVELFNLLSEFSPGIPPKILDVLQLLRLTDMRRLQRIQIYLKHRYARVKFLQRTIFDDPSRGCFAERYFDDSEDSQMLQSLHQRIEEAAEVEREEKKNEWHKLSLEFEELERDIAESTCLYTTENSRVVHDSTFCTKCYLERKAKRLKIIVHEHPLPTNLAHAKAVVFELGCPEALAAYRDATWVVLGKLAFSKQMNLSEPRLILKDYYDLEDFTKPLKAGITLASTTKSFQSTHYKSVGFPVSFDQVCVPNGLKFAYFDTLTKTWPGRWAGIPTFAHLCALTICANSPFSSLQFSSDFAADSDGPSSNEIVASQTRCLSGLNVHEFMAFESLFSGKHRRWLTMLIELGSSNLNFSTEAVASIMSQLALQAGPEHELDPLRAVHRFFRDESFCSRLMEQINLRLEAASSWRETNCMDMLLTFILRLCFIATEPIVSKALKLLEAARVITLKWITQLRTESRKSTSSSESEILSKHSFWAALLCKRTFAIHAQDIDAEEAQILQPAALRCFIECSITLQDNLIGNPTTLPPVLRNALIRDLKLSHRIRKTLRRSLEASPESLKSAINNVWVHPENDVSRSFSEPTWLDKPFKWWIQLTVDATRKTRQQTVLFEMLTGYLLVDGRPLGKLPAKVRKSEVLNELFGDQRLLTYPSGLRDMTYVLAFRIEGHQIHIGFRNGDLIVRACIGERILEYIPSRIFRGASSLADLPIMLIKDCVHWLDLNSGILEIREKPEIWKFKLRHWRLDIKTKEARRRESVLVDPHSSLFKQVAKVFDRFEYSGLLTIYQPKRGSLSVELRRLDLSFFVNTKKLLQCRELRSEIDPDQDAKTWYGLMSKIVLRDTINIRQRSIIIPLGTVHYVRNKFHVEVDIKKGGRYGKFAINDILGRLDCPVEPRLLYLKAQLHAFTSFILPDPLTGRTGSEEALHCLRSSYCQPWTTLNEGPLGILLSIAELTPKREYYPKDMKIMQRVFWDPSLTTTIQNDEFRSTVEAICEKLNQLGAFALKKPEILSFDYTEDSLHLLRRSHSRRRLYLRPSSDLNLQQPVLDLSYINARDNGIISQACINVFESVTLIREWPSKIHTVSHLARTLEAWPTIGGFDRCFDKFLLSDRLDVHVALEWGSLVNLCRTSEQNDMYQLMFLFAPMSFHNDVEIDIVRTLIAFIVLRSFKDLEPPKWPSYTHFRLNETPNVEFIMNLIKGYRIPYPRDERSTLELNLSSKLRRQLLRERLEHDKQSESDCKALAEFLLAQWPCPEPTVEGIPSLRLVDVAQAFEIVRPEWLRLFQNMELSLYIQQVQQVLNHHQTSCVIALPKVQVEDHEVLLTISPHHGKHPMLSQDLLCKASTILPQKTCTTILKESFIYDNVKGSNALSTTRKDKVRDINSSNAEAQELESIISDMTISQSDVKQRYAQDLMQSLVAFKMLKNVPKHVNQLTYSHDHSSEISKAFEAVRAHFNSVCMVIENDDFRARWLKDGNLWPCISPITLLEQLRSNSPTILGDGVKENLVNYGLLIIRLQRLLRIEDAFLRRDGQKFSEELENLGHTNWQPLEYPDWILLEIDANIQIRHDQVDVALATISPASKSNSLLQMNMGQGKTSCIMPMAAAVLADKKKLLRIVVPKQLLLQTAQVLQARLGGLVGREVWHIPFSRKTPTDSEIMKVFYNIHKKIRGSSAVMVALPDHILSFMLSGMQRLSDNRICEATDMINMQDWMRRFCRDVLDECDFTLAVRTQLIYPSGAQATVDGHPHRWETAEALLQLVEAHLWNLQKEFPRSIEVIRRPQGGFPMIFILRSDVEDALFARIVKDISCGQIAAVPAREYTYSDRLAIKQFISDAVVRPATAEKVSQIFSHKSSVKENIYLIRGLLVHRILIMTLKKRWNVQYGLHPSRDPIAVPFHAKGVPSEQAEWGHPDVAILFTCLAFYYNGLNVGQLHQSLQHVMKSDDPSSEYDRWTYSSKNLPDSLREWNIINVDDSSQLLEIWQHVRYNVIVINYFLNHFVFPKHAKQFQTKLQASGWDIPLILPEAQPLTGQGNVRKYSKPLTTGFSGTNDNRTVLPLTISQEDLHGLSHTNAEVLTYLLQRRNRTYLLAGDRFGNRLSEIGLLRLLSDRGIRMLIDAGAQILEMDNLSLVKQWLKECHEAPAAVFFNSENKPIVRYRNGSEIPLLATPFAGDLGDCLVYLDEAHTRGTDLKMPANAKGALTLSLGQTKDHTVQG